MYQALYRKYRPIDFDSVVGQNAIIKTLKNSIIHQNFTHAYLFYGSRGTGKTTVSKVFARSINCMNPVDGCACGKCDACKNSFSKECVDIIEIDAASNNGVDEIRELRNNVNLVPSNLKYKVYIIDEVHMLSDSAFNALLKTLEEPPQHIVFILATTELQKVPETIISRCQCFSFKKISSDMIKDRLSFICESEKIKIDSSILDKIAILSDGGLRDAIGSLDKLLSYKSSDITIEDFNEINGIVSDEDITQFISYVFDGNISDMLVKISDFHNSGKNLIQIMIQIIDFIRNLVVDYYIHHSELPYSITYYESFINYLNEKMFDIKKANNTVIYFEMSLLKYVNDTILLNSNIVDKNISNQNIIKDNSKDTKLDKNIGDSKSDTIDKTKSNDLIKESNKSTKTNDFVPTNNTKRIINISEINAVRINNTFATADKKLLKYELELFQKLKDYSFDSEIGYLVNSILDSNVRVVGSNNLILSYDTDALVRQNLDNILQLNEIYNKITSSHKNIAIVSDMEWNQLKDEYIQKIKNKEQYIIQKEPDVILEETKKNDIIVDSAISLFGEDVVEVE